MRLLVQTSSGFLSGWKFTKAAKRLARIVLRHLPINWRIAIKRWVGRDLSLIEQLALIDIPIAKHRLDGTQVLFWRGVPDSASIHTETIIALALRLRGINTRFVMCDAALSGCIQRSVEDDTPISEWRESCLDCIDRGVRILDLLGIPYIKMSELVSEGQRSEFRAICDDLPDIELGSYEYRQVSVGRFAESSTVRYLRGKPLEGHEPILREYLYSALVCSEAARNALSDLKPNRVVMQGHIEYVSWAPAYVILTKAGLPVTLWGGDIGQCRWLTLRTVTSTDWRSRYSLTDETWERRSKQPLTSEEDERLMIAIVRKPWWAQGHTTHSVRNAEYSGMAHAPRERLLQELNIPDTHPIWCVFTHVIWDAGFYPEAMIFENVFDWTIATVQAMVETKNVTWLLKIHPGESLGTSRGVEEIIKGKFPEAIRRFHIIPADSKISTSDLCSILAGGVTMHGTIGVQLPVRGIPVIVGERTHYAGKGFTYDGFTREQYRALIHQAADIPPLSEHQRSLAKRYAYAGYIQRRIPLNMARGRGAYAPLEPERFHLLFPGNDGVMDMICDRIMNGGDFVLDDDMVARYSFLSESP